MFCPKCGNKAPDGTAFCSKCGTQFGRPKASAQTSNPPVSMQAGSAVAVTPNDKKSHGAVIGIVVAVVVIALVVVLVRMFACSGPDSGSSTSAVAPDKSSSAAAAVSGSGSSAVSSLNLTELINADSSTYKSMFSKFATNEELNSRLGYDLYSGSKQFLDNYYATLKKQGKYSLYSIIYPDNVWTLVDSSYSASGSSKSDAPEPEQRKLQFDTYCTKEILPASELAEIVNGVVPFTRGYIKTERNYSGGYSFLGGAMGDDCFAKITAKKEIDSQGEAHWHIALVVTQKENKALINIGERDFETEYEKFDASKYEDSYKK